MLESRHQFREDLREIEGQMLGGIDLVLVQFDRALESLIKRDVELAGKVVAADVRVDRRYLEVHQGVILLLARQTPVAGDLRLVAALFHVIRCIERMGDQCANIAKLVPLSSGDVRRDGELVAEIERMAKLVRQQLADAKEVFKTRHVSLAKYLIAEDVGIGRLNRAICTRAVEIGEDSDVREWAMFMILVARALERISDNALDIAEQTVFVVTGLFGESVDVSHPT